MSCHKLMASKLRFSLAFLAQQLTFLCVFFALWRPYLWLVSIDTHLRYGNDYANLRNFPICVLMGTVLGAFIGGIWSRACRGAVIGSVVGVIFFMGSWIEVHT